MRLVKSTDKPRCFSPGCKDAPMVWVWTKAPGPRRQLCDTHAIEWDTPPNDWVHRAIRFGYPSLIRA